MHKYIDFIMYSLLILLCVITPLIKRTNATEHNYKPFDRNYTNALRGFAILTVVWAHAGGKDYGIGGIQWIAGIGVCIFLICSGFGLNESYKNNGLKNYWKKRIICILLPYYIIYILGECFRNNWVLSKEYIVSVLLLREQWYIGYLFICYTIFYIVKFLVKNRSLSNHTELIIFIVIFSIWFIVDSLFIAEGDNYMTRSRQMFSFIVGIEISYHYKSIVSLVKKTQVIFNNLLIGLLFLVITNIGTIKSLPILIKNLLSLFTVLPLAIAIIGICIRRENILHSQFLSFVGGISFEIYLTEYFVRKTIGITNLVSLVICFAVTIVISYILHFALKYMTEKALYYLGNNNKR